MVKAIITQNNSAIETSHSICAQLKQEERDWQAAGFWGRLIMRSIDDITRDFNTQQSMMTTYKARHAQYSQEVLIAETAYRDAVLLLAEMERTTGMTTSDKHYHQEAINGFEERKSALHRELGVIIAKLEDIRNSVIRDARIIGATVTRTFLRPSEFTNCDVVIIDEASMILLPAVFHAAGLSTDKVVVAGDFQQLPPIIQTEQHSISKVLAPNIFERAGICIDNVSDTPRMVMLTEQFRMNESICNIVSSTFYGNRLVTNAGSRGRHSEDIEPLANPLTIIDTSSAWPFAVRNSAGSRINLMHALAIRNIVYHLSNHDMLYDKPGRCRVGICTPYSAQARLLRSATREFSVNKEVIRAATVHGFQGDERPTMILDLVDSTGVRGVGIFWQAIDLQDTGAKLLNVAISRAKDRIVIVGNLTFLDAKLPSNAILRGVLHAIQRAGRIVDISEVLALRPIVQDLARFQHQPILDPETLRTGLFRGDEFARVSRKDCEMASSSIVVYSAFITPERAGIVGDLFRAKIQQGVKVKCVTRPPNRNGSIPEQMGRSALAALEAIGVAVDLRDDIHEKVLLIDNRIAWFGSLNPLSHTSYTSELMARIEDRDVASQIAWILCLRRCSRDELDNGAAAEPENPRCEACGGWSVLKVSRYGPYFRCAQGCDWKKGLDLKKG